MKMDWKQSIDKVNPEWIKVFSTPKIVHQINETLPVSFTYLARCVQLTFGYFCARLAFTLRARRSGPPLRCTARPWTPACSRPSGSAMAPSRSWVRAWQRLQWFTGRDSTNENKRRRIISMKGKQKNILTPTFGEKGFFFIWFKLCSCASWTIS